LAAQIVKSSPRRKLAWLSIDGCKVLLYKL
jgi:hypothetical protein